MKIGVYRSPKTTMSLGIYQTNIIRELKHLGVDISQFHSLSSLPKGCDLFWMQSTHIFPKLPFILNDSKPLVLTVHGMDHSTMPLREMVWPGDWKHYRSQLLRRYVRSKFWVFSQRRVSAVITVSKYAQKEVKQALHLFCPSVYAIHHGIDHNLFYPSDRQYASANPYFFHVSSPRSRKKNVERIIAAYQQIPVHKRPFFRVVLPGSTNIKQGIEGLEVIDKPVKQNELANLYRDAFAFIFPSLHETFGFPILEAMASGCPVLTSTTTACPEIAGDAALLVDPRSIDQIKSAMLALIEDANLRSQLRQKGLQRAEKFSWEKSARKHLEVFKSVVKRNV